MAFVLPLTTGLVLSTTTTLEIDKDVNQTGQPMGLLLALTYSS